MVRSRTQQQLAHDRRDGKALADASWALRRLTGRSYYHGAGDMLYAVSEVLDRASLEIGEVGLGVRGCLLQLARSIQQDARLAAASDAGSSAGSRVGSVADGDGGGVGADQDRR
jgi:hypothetical protein